MSDKKENVRLSSGGDSGAIVVEAIISLTSFVFAIVTVLTVVNICLIQARMAHAINTTASEISQYSYLYSLTGFNQAENEIYQAGKLDTQQAEEILPQINTVYNEIENLAGSGLKSDDDIGTILSSWDDAAGSIDNIEQAGSKIYGEIQKIADDPKNLLFGIAKLASAEGFDLVKSRLIAAPLAKVFCKKHLVSEKGGDVEAFLSSCGVVPAANGSYLDGLDFRRSELFPYGTPVIKIRVEYDVKVIPLLPIKAEYHFCQTAITHGWLAGDVSFETTEKTEQRLEKSQSSIWITDDHATRNNYLTSLFRREFGSEGYEQVTGKGNGELMYSDDLKELVKPVVINPFDDYTSPEKIKQKIEQGCASVKSTAEQNKTFDTKRTSSDGSTVRKKYESENTSSRLVIIIPDDAEAKETVEKIVSECETHGVTVEILPLRSIEAEPSGGGGN